MQIIKYSQCQCGAITVFTDTDESYSCFKDNFTTFFPYLDLSKLERYPDSINCDHCINHYELDLCGCGSGELFGQCNNHLYECKKPMQAYGKYTKVIARNPWSIKLNDIIQKENEVSQMIDTLKEKIVNETISKPMDGVTSINTHVCVVNYSALKRDIWSPEYYIPYKQAEYISKALAEISTASSFARKINEIISTQIVRIGSHKYPINEQVINILKNYIMEDK